MLKRRLIYLQLFIFLTQFTSFYANAGNPDAFLKLFKSNPKLAIDQKPQKMGEQDQVLLQEKIRACRREKSRATIMRQSQTKRTLPTREWTDAKAEALDFLELPPEQVIDQITAMDGKLQKAVVDVRPWSNDYWPYRTGALARRYMDPKFPASMDKNTWLEAFQYFQANLPWQLTDKSLLSPAEKYDNYVGDNQWTLTNANWDAGRQYHERYGDVEKWMGLCHGWAPASFMEPRPTQTVKLKSLGSEEDILFLPDDIKGLATLKWAYGVNVTEDMRRSGTRFIGGRCDEKEPKKDEENGRLTEPQCFDLNPGLWHTVVVNQIANEKRPFIIDASFDYEVWNQPVIAYGYEYFNPKTGELVETLAEARVSADDKEFKDPFLKYRNSSEMKSLVGIKMWVKYVVETSPLGRDHDNEKYDRTMSSVYYYDLELDADDRIIGGEWYQNIHPDFIWMPVKNSVALNREDLAVKSLDDVRRVAPDASRAMAPLRFVLDQLLDQTPTQEQQDAPTEGAVTKGSGNRTKF